jgi:hypothetical protein
VSGRKKRLRPSTGATAPVHPPSSMAHDEQVAFDSAGIASANGAPSSSRYSGGRESRISGMGRLRASDIAAIPGDHHVPRSTPEVPA